MSAAVDQTATDTANPRRTPMRSCIQPENPWLNVYASRNHVPTFA